VLGEFLNKENPMCCYKVKSGASSGESIFGRNWGSIDEFIVLFRDFDMIMSYSKSMNTKYKILLFFLVLW